jgi:hypothetical protein
MLEPEAQLVPVLSLHFVYYTTLPWIMLLQVRLIYQYTIYSTCMAADNLLLTK